MSCRCNQGWWLLCIPVFRLDMFVWLRYSEGLAQFSFKSGLNGVCINNNRASLQHQELHVHSQELTCTFPTLCEKCVGYSPANQYRGDAGDGAYGLSSFSEKIECLTIFGWSSKSSKLSSVTLRPWVLVWSEAGTLDLPCGTESSAPQHE